MKKRTLFLMGFVIFSMFLFFAPNKDYCGDPEIEHTPVNSGDQEIWDYTGTSYYLGDQDIFPEGFFWDGTYWWMIGSNSDQIHKYYSDWTYTGISHDISGQFTTPTDIFWDGTNWWGLGDGTADRVYKYDSNWSYTGISHYVGGQEPAPKGIFWDGTNWWVLGLNSRIVYKYNSDWSYAGESHYLGGQMDYPSDLYWDGVNWWVPGIYNNRVYIYNSDWSYTGSSYDLGGLDLYPTDVFWDGNYWYMLGYENSQVYQYYKGEPMNPLPLDDNILAWYTTWGGDQHDVINSMDIDKENNIYLAGYTRSYGAGDQDLCLVKFNSTGDLQWNVTWGDSNTDTLGSVSVDSQGYTYLVGYKNQGINDNDMWLIKYNSSGQMEWDNQIWPATASYYYIPEDIAVDSDDNIYITGYRLNISGSTADLILFKYNSSGSLIWDTYFGEYNAWTEVGRGIEFDSMNNIYIAGQNNSATSGYEILLVKFNSTGQVQWNKLWGGVYNDIGWDIALDSDNNIYITGETRITESTNKDLILLKYNNTGDFLWNRTWDGSDNDRGSAVICDFMNNVYITGFTLPGGDNDILIAKYDNNGNRLWVKVWGPGDVGSAFTMDINSYGNIFIGGVFTTPGNNDILLLKVRSLGRFNLTSDADNLDADGFFNLTWSASEYANNYSIYTHSSFISEINGSVTCLDSGIRDLNYSISGLTNDIYFYKVVAFNDVGNQSSDCIYIDVKIAPQIIFQPTLEYLNTTEPMEMDLFLEINCTVLNSTVLHLVYLSENSTGIFINRSMNLGINNEWSYFVDLSTLQRGDKLSFLFYANDSYYTRKNDNNNLNFSLFIGDIYTPLSNINFYISYNPNFVSGSSLFNITAFDIGERPSGILNISYKIDTGLWKEYNYPFNLSNFGEGLHTIYFNATDNVGNIENTNQITVYLDLNNINTSIGFIYYEDAGIKYITNTTEFSITWDDGAGSGLQNLYFKVDSDPYIAMNGSFTLSGYPEGIHNISLYTIDNVGNIGPENKFGIFLDNIPPELDPLSFELLYSPNYIYETTVLSFGVRENNGSLIKNSYWRIDDGIWNIGTNFTLYGFYSGEYTIHYSVIDNVGNSNNATIILYLITPTSDIDNDGLNHSEELFHKTDPFIEDTDADKLSDGDEVNIYKTNPLSRDTDGDGYSDYDEVITYRTDPNNALSSFTINVIIIIIIFTTISISSYVGIKKGKTIHRRRIEKSIVTQILDDKIKVLDCNALNNKLQKVKSCIDFEMTLKERNINGQFIQNRAFFVKNIGIEKLSAIIKEILNEIHIQNLSKQERGKLIKINFTDLEQDERILEFIRDLSVRG